MQSFEYYLRDKGLSGRTSEENIKDIKRFKQWADENNFTGTDQLNYSELLRYVQHLKNQSLSIHTINIRVNSLRKYYDHLKEEGIIEKNPARHLHIKGQMQKVIEKPFTYTELETLYNQYAEYSKLKRCNEVPAKSGGKIHYRNLTMLGLMIWQGVHSGELKKMEVRNIKLNEGIVYIPSTERSNSREIKLDARQIITAHKYSSELPSTQEKLFTGNVHIKVMSILRELKGINPLVKNAQHIRASVILHWLKMYDKRQVQYLCGHRYISSTQHYEVQELDGLTDLLQKHHPFS